MARSKTKLILIFASTLVLVLLALTASFFTKGQLGEALLAPQPVLAQEEEPAWKWSVEKLKSVVGKVRAGRDMTPKSWPNGARVAVGLSFDVDTEPVWIGTFGATSPGYMSRGEYGARVALDRILALVEKYDIPATFFIPASNVHLHPDVLKKVSDRPQHEIGLHSWVHENMMKMTGEEEKEVYKKAMDAIKDFTGKAPVGIRTAAWDFSDSTASICKELGLIYDSSLMADDRPYMLLVDGKETGMIELPVEWILDDWPFFQLNWITGHWPIRNGDDVFKVWSEEFNVAYEEGTMFVLTMHPQVIGHRYRMVMLEKLIQHIKSMPGVWFATHEEIARYALEHGGQ